MRPWRWAKMRVRPFWKKTFVSKIGGALLEKLEVTDVILPFIMCYIPIELVNNRYLVEIFKVYQGEMRTWSWAKIRVRPFWEKTFVSKIGGALLEKLEVTDVILPFIMCYIPIELVNNRYLVKIFKVYQGEMRTWSWAKIKVWPFWEKTSISKIGGALPGKLKETELILSFIICLIPMERVNNRYLVEKFKVYQGKMRTWR